MNLIRICLSILLITGLTGTAEAGKKHKIIRVHTELGDIYMTMFDSTPRHRDNFIKLAKEGFFNGTTFHRVIKNFVVQGGDPNSKDNDPKNDGNGGPPFKGAKGTFKDPTSDGYTLDPEIYSTIKHKYGSVAAAREGNDVNPEMRSSGSQFYIVIRKDGLPNLDNKYTVFGQVLKGMDVAEKIADQPKDASDRPLKNITMEVKVMKMSDKKIEEMLGREALQMVMSQTVAGKSKAK